MNIRFRKDAKATPKKWERPFSIKCEKCGVKIGVPKMKEQAKKELKAENKAKK